MSTGARLRQVRAAAALDSDPLAYRRFSSPQAREFFEAVSRQLETLLRSGNKASKTFTGAQYLVASSQGRPEVDGRTIREAEGWTDESGVHHEPQPYRTFRMPEIRTPNTWWVLVHGLKLAVDSVVEAVHLQLGNYPHRPIPSQASGMIAGWYVRPWGSDAPERDCKKRWSKILLFPEKGSDPTSGRVDGIWADEPPLHSFWQEMRMRGRALNAPFFSMITFTPKKRERWEMLRKDFENCLHRVNQGRYEIVMSVYDNQALSPEDIRKIEEKVRGDELELARLFGQYVDISGANPFRKWGNVLTRWRKECDDPQPRHARVRALIYDLLTGQRSMGWEDHEWQLHEEYDPTDEYWMVFDPSMGIEDPEGEHSPAGGGVLARGKPYWDEDGVTLVERFPYVAARFNGYPTSYTLGSIAAQMWNYYGGPPFDVDNTGAYGEACIGRMIELGCSRPQPTALFHRPGSVNDDIGFKSTDHSNQQILSSIQRVLEESRQADTFHPRNGALVESLMSAQVDRHGRLIQGSGRHTEDITWLGRALYRHFSTALDAPPRPRRMTIAEVVEREAGPRKMGSRHPRIRWG